MRRRASFARLVVLVTVSLAGATTHAAAQPAAASASLAQCLSAIRSSPAAKRIADSTWQRHVSGLTFDARVVEQRDAQPEFKLPVWDYFAVMVDPERIADGQRLLAEHRATFDVVERRYGVDRHVVAAIWGIESDFGRGMGGYDVLRSLATLGCNGRRQPYFRRELLAALRIVQRGDVDGARFRGSWAGAFGQVQFMPGSFEWLAVDGDGDGQRDIIGSVPDALASAANYLRKSRWKTGAPWGMEVHLPQGFVVAGEGRKVKRPLSAWRARGVRRVGGDSLWPAGTSAATVAGLHLPTGPKGPAFLVFDNFDAIYRYNASEVYTLAIAHLSDRLRGTSPFVAMWPTDDPGLSRAERRELQRLLTARGHDVGAPTGVLTARTRAAVKAEQERLGHEATGRPGQRLLQALRER
jgi:lytic murein transglycosylase